MTVVRLIERPAFIVAGKQTYISGPDNEQFGRFWQQCRDDGFLRVFDEIKQANDCWAGAQTHSDMLGVSRVEQDPSKREFFYMIAIEVPAGATVGGLEVYQVPASTWGVFECRGAIPEALVESEMYAFGQWLPQSGYVHAHAPEMEVYPAYKDDTYCEFWLPVARG